MNVMKQDDLEYIQKLFESIPKAIEFTVKYCKNVNWEIVHKAMEILKREYE